MHTPPLHRLRVTQPLALLGLVAMLAAAVTASAGVDPIDAALGALAREPTSLVSSNTETAISALAATSVVMPLTALAAAVLVGLRRWQAALTVVVAVLGTQAVVQAIKLLVERPRPELNESATAAHGFSFPSAHSATAMALYATLALIVGTSLRGRARAAVWASGAALIGAVGLSRVMLAAHYPVDVLAGWLTGAAVVLASVLLVRRLSTLRSA